MNYGLQILLDLNGFEFTYESGHWYQIEAKLITPTKERPQGIRYNLTLHDKSNKRIFGMDNTHAVRLKKKITGKSRSMYDHLHKSKADKGTPYEFENAEKLLKDFFDNVHRIIGI